MAESQLSHLPAIGGMKEMGRVELVYHKNDKNIIKTNYPRREGVCIRRFTYIRRRLFLTVENRRKVPNHVKTLTICNLLKTF